MSENNGVFPESFPEIKKLGFGLMRLPGTRADEGGKADIDEVIRMVDAFMDAGFSYFDTAYVYDGGDSEKVAKEVLVDRYPRQKFQLASKLNAMMAPGKDEALAQFDISLERTGAGFFDFYLVHNVTRITDAKNEEYGVWDFVAQKKEEGLIRNLGFSFHDKADFLDEMLEKHADVDFVQLQINWADWDNVVVESRKCYEVARKHGKPIMVMEPIKGGSLIALPEDVTQPLYDLDPEQSLPSWALRFAASLPGVYVVLSGMHSLLQMQDNIEILDSFAELTKDEGQALLEAGDLLAAKGVIPCTDCRYCMEGCPQGIKIPAILNVLNGLMRFNDIDRAQKDYNFDVGVRNPDAARASTCIACGACEDVCPQHIDIIDQLKHAAEMFDEQ